ncbi:hypothetical protein [Gaoshiqia sediminis]|uniref:Uncharacterized protein n=1 Tax=Gaoshiqia sediminis TaxID=2986998 RepID=A0AA41Y9T3_9BACT|nr:hypothetical protein [Gaoshiqia sediminis]MCW0481885.1 hypothetical protein [Gaoshiqia sediminis]
MKKLSLPLVIIVVGIIAAGIPFLFSGSNKASLDISINSIPLIMPAAHKVYANPDALNGQYHLFKAKITNTGKKTLENVVVKYQVPGHIEWTEISTTGIMIPGQTIVAVCYPVFNPSVTSKTTESVERANVTVEWEGADHRDIIEESFTFKMLSRNDFAYTCIPSDEILGWGDVYDNDPLLPCFVTPNDPIVKYYTQIVQEKVLKGEAASVTRSPEQGVQFMLGLYEATRMSHMVYSGTKGIPQNLQDVQTLIQHVRLPREVITGNTGLCIELSVLYASVLSNAGLDPIIYLIPGHAYPGFKIDGQYYAIEATGIGGEGLGKISSAQEAYKLGMEQLDEFIKATQAGDPRYSIIDVHQLNASGVISMNLDDNDYLRKKVDEIAENFTPKHQQVIQYVQQPVSNQLADASRFPGPLSFLIPTGWVTYHNPAPGFPLLIAQITSPDMVASVSVYNIPASSAEEAMHQLKQYFSQMGLALQYSISGSNVQGTSANYTTTFRWIGKIAPMSGGYRLVAVGSDNQLYSQYTGVINSVYNSIR